MPVIIREGSWRIWIFTNDHGFPHVHVYRRGAKAKILLPSGESPVRILSRRGMTDRDAGAALVLVEAHAAELISAWKTIHGLPEID